VRTQAVPLGAARPVTGARAGRGGRGRNDRAARSAYTWILAGVLVIGVIALYFALSYVFGSGSSSGQPATKPQVTASPLPNPSPQSSPPPFQTPVPSPSPAPVGTAPVQPRVHVVEGGDTLSRIAQRYGVTVDAIMQANGIPDRSRVLRIGERLAIPDAAPGSPVPR
jgi:LysM repeat protein